MKILHVISSVNPRGGGPMEGIRQYGQRLPHLGHALEVVSLDAPDCAFIADFPLVVHALGPSSMGNYCFNSRLVPWLRLHARDYDAVVVNGLWQYHALAAWRALRSGDVPYFVFTHGMLDPWFKHNYPLKHLKKWMYWPWADYRVLRDARAVLFTSEEERNLARESFWLYKANEVVVSYGASSPPADGVGLRARFLASHPSLNGKRLLLFLGRIHEKKGCDLLIEAFASVAQASADLHLVMAGPDQTGWMAQLKQRTEALGIAERVSWLGMLEGDVKWGAFFASEVFVLPSHQENFGIAVAEALGCGLPVLISNKVNIWREIEQDGAGLVEADTRDGTERLLLRWLALETERRAEMRTRATATFANRFAVDAMAADLTRVIGGSLE